MKNRAEDGNLARELILVVDDEEDILELVEYNLKNSGYRVSCVTTGEDAVKAARRELPDLIVLDLMLPGLDGFEVCKILKNDSKTGHIPILMLTAKADESDIVAGLELGSDEYVTKPFSPRVLTARVKALLRRSERAGDEDSVVLKVHDLVINPGRHEVFVDGAPVELTQSEFKLLHLLARRPGWVFSRDRIIDEVHGADYAVTTRSVDVLIVGLRKKLGDSGKLISTVRGVGYRMKE